MRFASTIKVSILTVALLFGAPRHDHLQAQSTGENVANQVAVMGHWVKRIMQEYSLALQALTDVTVVFSEVSDELSGDMSGNVAKLKLQNATKLAVEKIQKAKSEISSLSPPVDPKFSNQQSAARLSLMQQNYLESMDRLLALARKMEQLGEEIAHDNPDAFDQLVDEINQMPNEMILAQIANLDARLTVGPSSTIDGHKIRVMRLAYEVMLLANQRAISSAEDRRPLNDSRRFDSLANEMSSEISAGLEAATLEATKYESARVNAKWRLSRLSIDWFESVSQFPLELRRLSTKLANNTEEGEEEYEAIVDAAIEVETKFGMHQKEVVALVFDETGRKETLPN